MSYLAAIAVIAGVAAGVSPAAHLWRSHAAGLRGQSTRAIAGGRHEWRLLDALVSLEMALTLVLLIGAGVLIRSVREVTTADIVVVTGGTWTASLYLPPERYASADARPRVLR